MSYYRVGDYYLGDPGLFGSIGKFIGKAGGVIGKTVGGLLAGGPIGAAVGLAGGLAGALAKKPGTAMIPFQGGGGLPAPVGGRGIGLPGPFRIDLPAILPGGRPFVTREGGRGTPGYHLDKKTGTYLVRNRSMNPANPRALRRAIRREQNFVKLARRTLRGTGISIGRRSFARKKVGRR